MDFKATACWVDISLLLYCEAIYDIVFHRFVLFCLRDCDRFIRFLWRYFEKVNVIFQILIPHVHFYFNYKHLNL